MVHLPQIAAAIVASKVEYGIAIYGSVRLSESDPIENHHRSLQVALNNAMRVAAGRRRSEHVKISELCEITKIRSVNRMSAEAKLSLIWSSQNSAKSPLANVFRKQARKNMASRAIARQDLASDAKSELSKRNVVHQSVRIWNAVDLALRKETKKPAAKKIIRCIAGTLPL